jgi:hypothetical protein
MPHAVPNPGGVVTEDNLRTVLSVSMEALNHVIAQGEVAEFKGRPMKAETAVRFLRDFVSDHRAALIQGSSGFLESLARRIVQADGPDVPIEEFEAQLASLSDVQLTELSELEADTAASIVAGIVDKRRELLAALLGVGKVLLRGAIATGLTAILGPAGLPVAAGLSALAEGGGSAE